MLTYPYNAAILCTFRSAEIPLLIMFVVISWDVKFLLKWSFTNPSLGSLCIQQITARCKRLKHLQNVPYVNAATV